MTVSLHLNGQQVKGHELTVSVSLPLASEDVSGQTSSTAKVEQGDKGKTVSVDLSIKFSNAKDLTALVTLAEAKNGDAERVVYSILEHTANAMNVRQVKFDGNLIVTEERSLQAWKVSFSLAEYNSVPEKKEARVLAAKKPVSVQKSTAKPDNTVVKSVTPAAPVAPSNPTPPAPKTAPELSSIEKMLKRVDNALANK